MLLLTQNLTAAAASDATVTTAQAQSATAPGGVSQAAVASTAQAQTAAAVGGIEQAAAVTTQQAQTAAGTVGVSMAGSGTTAQTQTANAAASASIDAVATTAQAQASSAVVELQQEAAFYVLPIPRRRRPTPATEPQILVGTAHTGQTQSATASGAVGMTSAAMSSLPQSAQANGGVFDTPLHDFMELLLMAA